MSQFQPNLAQTFGKGNFKFVQLKGHTLFEREFIAK